MEKLGKDAADAIDWSFPAVYCIANAFGKYDLHAIKQMNRNIRLIRYANGGDIVMFEYLNAPTLASVSAPSVTTNTANGKRSDKTYTQQYEETTDELREIVEEIRHYMAELGDDVSENVLKLYLAIKKVRNIVCVEIYKTRLVLHLHLNPDTVKLGDNVVDARTKGHRGTGDLEIIIKTMEEFEEIKPLLERAYLEN